MYIDEYAIIEDNTTFVLKLIQVLDDNQLRALIHVHYNSYSIIRSELEAEMKSRGLSIEVEFNEKGEFKY